MDPLYLQELVRNFTWAHTLMAPIPMVLQGECCKLGGVVNLAPGEVRVACASRGVQMRGRDRAKAWEKRWQKAPVDHWSRAGKMSMSDGAGEAVAGAVACGHQGS